MRRIFGLESKAPVEEATDGPESNPVKPNPIPTNQIRPDETNLLDPVTASNATEGERGGVVRDHPPHVELSGYQVYSNGYSLRSCCGCSSTPPRSGAVPGCGRAARWKDFHSAAASANLTSQ